MKPSSSTPPRFDAWCLARLLSGAALTAEQVRAAGPARALVEQLAGLAGDDRSEAWERALEDDPAADAWIEAVAACDPEGPPPVADAAEAADGWGPLRLRSLPAAVPFPVDVFPEPVQLLVDEAAEAIGCSPDLVALPVLAVAGGVVGRSVSLLLRQNHFASACIYAATIGPPSDGKTPALKIVAAPVRQIDEELAAAWARDKAEYERAKEAYESGKKRSRSEGDGADREEPPARPVPGRIDVDEATMEVVPLLLEQSPRGLVMIRDELSSLVQGMNQYKGGKGNDRPILLKIWSGDSIKKDRVGHDDFAPVRVSFPSLSIVGGLPPDMLGELADPKGRSDGFLDRFLMAFPDPRPVPDWSDVGVPEETAGDWADVVLRLWQRPLQVKDGKPCPHVAHLSPAGRTAWAEAFNTHAHEMNGDDFPPTLRGPWGKFREYAARLALVLALIRHAADPTSDPVAVPDVGRRDVLDAWRLVAYFKAQFRRVAASMRRRNGLGTDAQSILRWIRRASLSSFPQSDLTRNFPRFRTEPDDLDLALKQLCEASIIRARPEPPAPPSKRGRKALPTFEVHPSLLDPENCDNCGDDPLDQDSSNTGNCPDTNGSKRAGGAR